MSESIPPLSLGGMFGGLESPIPEWRGVWRHATALVSEARVGHHSPLAVNVVFQIPGELLKPDFVGMRTGRFSRRSKALMIQVAVPEGPPPPRAILYLLELVSDAIDVAEQFGTTKKVISEPLDELRQIVEEARAQSY